MFDTTFFSAAGILFREGLEALLVIAVLAAFLRRAGAQDKLPMLYAGAGLAVLASFGLAWIFQAFFGGAHNDLLEAGVMAIAAVLLFYMSGWLFVRQDQKAWTAELNRRAGEAVDKGTAWSLAAIAFLAVFREGAETILFLYALALGGNGWSMSLFAGLAVATIVLVGVFVAMQWLAIRLPLRPIFLVTSALLFLVALKMVGEAIQELQEQALVPVTNDGVPDIAYALGLNPSWEALGPQIAIVIVALGLALWASLRKPAAASAPATAA